MAILQCKGYGEYSEGISVYSNHSNIFTFDITESTDVDERGEKAKSFYIFEFPNVLTIEEIKTSFEKAYLEYHGFSVEKLVHMLYGSPTEEEILLYNNIASKARYYSAKINSVKNELDIEKDNLIAKVKAYDTSNNVNSFILNGKTLWLSKDTRVGLVNSINYEKSEGNSITNLWYEGIKYTLNIDTALVMLKQLELYALECYNTTQTHIANISKLKTVEEVKSYNYKTGYPSILNFKAG